MAAIVTKAFNGMKPIAHPLLLQPGDAQLAKNVRLISGAISALRGTTTLKSASALSRTIYRYGSSADESSYWLEWQDDVDVVSSPIAQDQWNRLYWTDGQFAKYAPNSLILSGGSYPGGYYRLGVPKPGAAPTISNFSDVPEYVRVTRSYVITLFNPTTGKESSATSAFTVQAVEGFKVSVAMPTDNGGDSGATKKRIYRKVGDTYRRVAEVAVDEANYDDEATDGSLAAAPALATGVQSRPTAPKYAPAATAEAVTLSDSAISREYIYTVRNVYVETGSGDSLQTYYYNESNGSSPVSVMADETQRVTLTGLSTSGVTATTGAVFRVYRKDVGESMYRFVGETTGSSFTDVIESSSNLSSLPAYSPDAPSTVAPTSTPSASTSASTAITSTVKRLYVVTFVDSSGNESPPSPASNTVDVINGQTKVTIRHSDSAPSGATKRRLYRQTVAVSGASITINEASYKLVAENAVSATSFIDTVADASLGASLSTALQGLPPAPANTSSAAATIPANVVPESRTYVYTFVSAYGEEGPPSDASEVVALDPAGDVTITLPSGAPSGPYNLTLKRIYRSSTVGNQALFQFVAEVPIATGSYTDSKDQAELGEVLPSESWTPPPEGLKGLRMMANGVAVGFVGNTVWFSEPNLPHAWPHSYPVDAEIVGLGTFGQTVVIVTKSYPHLLQGVDPAAMSMSKMELRQAGTSKASIVETGDGVMYASPDGLVSVGNGIQLLTQNILSRDQWLAYNPESIKAYLHNGRWHGFYTDDSGNRGLLIFDFTGQGAYMTVSDYGQSSPILAGHQDASTDTLYLLQGNSIVRFDSGEPLTYLWRSKVFRLPQHANFAAAQVRASGYPVTMRVYADGQLKLTKTVASDHHFRLPSGFRALDWYFEIEGTKDVTEVFMVTSVAELIAT